MMAGTTGPVSINGYAVLKLKLPITPSYPQPAFHYLYLRQREPRIPSPEDERTLFVVNIPVDATEAHFRYLFSRVGGGRVEKVVFQGSKADPKTSMTPTTPPNPKNRKKRKRDPEEDDEKITKLPEIWDRSLHPSGSTALVVFVDKAGLHATLKAVAKRRDSTVGWGEETEGKVPALGSQRYMAHHRLRYPPRAALQSSVDAYMTHYAALEAQRARQAKRLRQQPDEDGFVTVTRGGRTGPARQEEAQAAAERQKQKATTGLKDFYRFQVREERKKAQGELLRKFEEDRRKVEEMKQRRGKFRPE